MLPKQQKDNVDAFYSRILLEKKKISLRIISALNRHVSPLRNLGFFLYASYNIKSILYLSWLLHIISASQYQKGAYENDGESFCKGKKWQDIREWF